MIQYKDICRLELRTFIKRTYLGNNIRGWIKDIHKALLTFMRRTNYKLRHTHVLLHTNLF